MNVQPFPKNKITVSGEGDILEMVRVAGEIAEIIQSYRIANSYADPVQVRGHISLELKAILRPLVTAGEIVFE